jgi:hypothetical protein
MNRCTLRLKNKIAAAAAVVVVVVVVVIIVVWKSIVFQRM